MLVTLGDHYSTTTSNHCSHVDLDRACMSSLRTLKQQYNAPRRTKLYTAGYGSQGVQVPFLRLGLLLGSTLAFQYKGTTCTSLPQ